jgi:hypothetical protein
MRRAYVWAAVSVTILFMYYEVYRWVPLRRWNWQFVWPVNNDQFYPDIVIGFLLVWIAWSFARVHRVSTWIGTSLLALWTAVHLFDWWIPYAKNAPENLGRFSFYSQRTQILPVIGGHYPPDAGHAILDFLLFPTFALALTATIANLRTGRPSPNAF